MLPFDVFGNSKAIIRVMIEPGCAYHLFAKYNCWNRSIGTRARNADDDVGAHTMSETVLVATVGMIVASLLACACAQEPARASMPDVPQAARTIPAQTLKERLGDKASDEQRVDNCKVPSERRGTKVRPDNCEHEVNPASAEPK
jgi:hypothetical protein